MRIAICGGTFDPFHRGHVEPILAVRDQMKWDHIIYVPAWRQPFKTDRETASGHHRFAMVALAIRDTVGGAFSAGGGVAGGVAESGGRETGGGPTRLTEEAAAGPTHSAGDDGSLAAGAGGETPSLGAAESGASAEAACTTLKPSDSSCTRRRSAALGSSSTISTARRP